MVYILDRGHGLHFYSLSPMPTFSGPPHLHIERCPDLIVYQIVTPYGLVQGWENSILVEVRNQTNRPTRNAARVRITTQFDGGPPRNYSKNLGTMAGNKSVWVSLDCFEVPREALKARVLAEVDPKGDCGVVPGRGCVDEGGGDNESNNFKRIDLFVMQQTGARSISPCAKYGKTLPER